MSYIVLRLADDSFVHVSFHDHTDDEVNPIASTAAFAHFRTATPTAVRAVSTSRPLSWSVPTSPLSTEARARARRWSYSTPNGDSRGSANEREGRCRSIYRDSATRRRLGPG